MKQVSAAATTGSSTLKKKKSKRRSGKEPTQKSPSPTAQVLNDDAELLTGAEVSLESNGEDRVEHKSNNLPLRKKKTPKTQQIDSKPVSRDDGKIAKADGKTVEDTSAVIDSLINSIPPRLYFTDEVIGKLREYGAAAVRKFPSRFLKCSSKASFVSSSMKTLSKFNDNLLMAGKVDPNLPSSVVDLLSVLAVVETDFAAGSSDRLPLNGPPVGDSSVQLKTKVDVSTDRLRTNLQEKLLKLAAKRKAVSERKLARNAKEHALSEKERLRLKRKMSKMKRKIRLVAEKEKEPVADDLPSSDNKKPRLDDVSSTPAAGKQVFKPKFNVRSKKAASRGMSKFQLESAGALSTGIFSTNLAGKDYRTLLQKVEKQKEAVRQIRGQGDTDTANQIESGLAWKAAIQRAQGVRVRDDPALLKKAIRRREKRKMKSKKEWDERTQKVADKQQRRQEKRQRNITQRKDARREKKLKKARKKGRLVD